MISKFISYKQEAIKLRKRGFTYGEVCKSFEVSIPKSTLSVWFKNIRLPKVAHERLKKVIHAKTKIAHQCALEANKRKRKEYLEAIDRKVNHLEKCLNNDDVAKIVLAVLYLGEGKKGSQRAFMLGNSDPRLVRLFLCLLRKCYSINESKFRCTLQCRADQDIPKLEKFWSNITKIPLNQFYKARIDPRTIGKKSKKPGYKGVCRIDYFSADIYNEIEKIIDVVCKTGH